MRKLIFSILCLAVALFFAGCDKAAAAARAPDNPAVKKAENTQLQPLEFQTVTADFREAVPVANYQTNKIQLASHCRSKEDAGKPVKRFFDGLTFDELSNPQLQPPEQNNIGYFIGFGKENSPRGKI